ncbi:hypothetical protein Phum_PHUM130780 [Pediculus humanus corporis]|uniref:Uncharacterized protein n=1 Tax=Pediculus humanus subsp. corporis TaxID=121224 RepID=E0VED0_PEDHC|nr:uncharacterized protein Phum_PHUM130780 [Pediculus humanus corporis]EEB11736.1 hypothetical protein Phum_PHUM130780 [Pediculus humanus corporis]
MYKKNEEKIDEIKDWISSRSTFIQTFLQGCDGDVDKTKKTFENYFFVRQTVREFFFDRDPTREENMSAWETS